MGKLRQTALILGEGPTEFFYFKSLCDVFKRLTIKPDYLEGLRTTSMSANQPDSEFHQDSRICHQDSRIRKSLSQATCH